MKLDFDVTPIGLRNRTLRKLLSRSQWEKLRAPVVERSIGKCEACGGPANPVFVHEAWEYDDVRHHRRLAELRGLCRDCSDATHLLNTVDSGGRQLAMEGSGHYLQGQDYFDYFRLLDHWCRVNGTTREDGNRLFLEIRTLRRSWRPGDSLPKWTQDWGAYVGAAASASPKPHAPRAAPSA